MKILASQWGKEKESHVVCLCRCPGPHHLIFCLLQDMMDLFETSISDMVDSFVVTVKGAYPFLSASVPLTMWDDPVQWPVWIHFTEEFLWHAQTFSQCQDLENSYYEKICANVRATPENMATNELEVDMSEEAKSVSLTLHLKYQD